LRVDSAELLVRPPSHGPLRDSGFEVREFELRVSWCGVRGVELRDSGCGVREFELRGSNFEVWGFELRDSGCGVRGVEL